MEFWDTKKLADELVADEISEKEKVNYVAFGVFFMALSGYILERSSSDSGPDLPGLTLFVSVLEMVLIFWLSKH